MEIKIADNQTVLDLKQAVFAKRWIDSSASSEDIFTLKACGKPLQDELSLSECKITDGYYLWLCKNENPPKSRVFKEVEQPGFPEHYYDENHKQVTLRII